MARCVCGLVEIFVVPPWFPLAEREDYIVVLTLRVMKWTLLGLCNVPIRLVCVADGLWRDTFADCLKFSWFHPGFLSRSERTTLD